jgi:hypothetical protein
MERILTGYFNRLIKDKTILEIKGLAARLETLQVWGVSVIKLSHEVDGIIGADDTSSLLFDDTDKSKLDIIYALNPEEAILNFELSEDFVEFCGITDKKLEKLVLPILTYPLKGIETLLESYGLDLPNDPHSNSAETLDSVSELSEENDAENSRIREINSSAIPSPMIPSSRSGVPHTPPDPPLSSQSSFLRDRIPALDERILSVRAAAARQNITPTLVITPSQRTNMSTPLMPGILTNSNEISFPTMSRTESGLPPPETKFGGSSTPSASGHGPQNSHGAFEFRDMNSALSSVLATASPSQNYGTSLVRHPHGSRFSQSPHNRRTEPDPRHTMEGLYNHYIGLQGEVFVSGVIQSCSSLQAGNRRPADQRVALQKFKA